MAEKQRVLMCGDVDGHFKFLFSKVEVVNKKNGPFDFLFCVGDFFGENNDELLAFKNGSKKVPVPTYIIGPNKPAHESLYPDQDCCEICPNLTYLGKRGLYTSSSGLKIAYVSGCEDAEQKSCSFDKTDVISVKNACLRGQPSFRGTDIMLTSPWPENITNLDPNKPEFKYKGSRLLAWLASHIKPRYHVCAMENIHYERPPYRNHSQAPDNIEIATRFIGLAKVGNPDGRKWLYALNLSPVDRTRLSDLVQKTTDETTSPYSKALLSLDPSNTKIAEPNKATQFFFDMDSREHNNKRKAGKNSDKPMKKRKFEFDQEKCWFCLSSAKVSQHLVIAVGKKVYLALAKGGVVDDHFLILPVAHHQNSASLPDEVAQEMEAFKEAVTKYYATTDRVPVFFDRNYKSSHCQVQAVPVPKQKSNLLKSSFEFFAKQNNFKLLELTKKVELKQIAPEGTLYFYVELPDGEKLFYRIKKDFPLQFGREVLCSGQILNCKNRVDWRDCLVNDEGEVELSSRIRKDFSPFNPDADSVYM